MDVVHIVPTTLLHSLEGMEGLDWEKLIKLQGVGGSFPVFSKASTAFAFMNTKDENYLKYLKKTVGRFNGGVPGTYPVDLFEHIWVVDRLERLGVSRYFQAEIKEIINCLVRYWTEHGIAWARHSNVHDIDDMAMGFRLLRLHGHNVSPAREDEEEEGRSREEEYGDVGQREEEEEGRSREEEYGDVGQREEEEEGRSREEEKGDGSPKGGGIGGEI
ncbi:hypothetical protein IFM89_000933 [Coptis chinensis]|uniref:Terpene synthase N-terminal domain-containing protein n=1 Tax=Coptis chinensis TaxID=261450 RepID=A0A835IMH2_9MAGN|nr:hypothetical protein IFM89_000933 [Coptis chinensis]